MQPKRYLKNWSLLLLLLISSTGCALFEPRTEIQTVTVKQNIPIQERPEQINLFPVKFYAVSENNIDSFKEEFKGRYGDLVFFAITVPHYENMALNFADIKRYIRQQQNLILYYENSIQSNDNE